MNFTFKKVLAISAVILFVAMAGTAATYSCSSAAGGQNYASTAEEDTTTVPRTVMVDQDKLDEITFTRLSSNFVDRVIHGLPVQKHLEILKNVHPDTLDDALDTPRKRLTFWMNMYNGYTQYFLKKDPSLYNNNRGKFFAKEQIPIAGYMVSMEDIEHGVLRKGAVIWSKGYLRIRAFRKDFIQKYAVDTVDFRIHYALNCGAKSCPPVVAYQSGIVAKQLNDVSRYYLQNFVDYQEGDETITVPSTMTWFTADFGGSAKDKRTILKEYGAIPEDASPKLKYMYDWTVKINNYKAFTY